jgi:hypothetical protein
MPINPDATPDFAFVDDALPERATPVHAWRIVKYLDEDGVECFWWSVEGDPNISETLGLLEMIKFDVLRRIDFFSDFDEED